MKIGAAFPESIRTEKIKRRGGGYSNKTYSIRAYLLPLFLILFTALIMIRLLFLQIVSGSYYRGLSDSNRTRTFVIHAPRGIIFDRNQIPLVFNVPGYREVPDGTSSKDKAKIISNDEAMKLISKGKTNLEIDSLRSYPYKDAASHVLGYIGQISEVELKQNEFADYKGGELIGKTGIEGKYEHILKGMDGKKLVEVDSLGKVVRKLGKTDPVPGKNITLTLDLDIQKAAFEAMRDVRKGAAIVSKPNGEILALVSKPSFDPNLFTLGESYSAQEDLPYNGVSEILLDQENQPLLNRTIGGVYPPGSTFKLVTAASALEEKKIDQNFEVEDTGVLIVGEFSFASWYFTQYGRKEGSLNVVGAIKRSNDIFFYKVAELVGADKLSDFAGKFGLGKILDIDLIGEVKGLVPTPLWKEKEIGDKWYLGDTYHYGIGQGFLLTTPLQVNVFTQVIATGGDLYTPHLLKSSTFAKATVDRQKFLSDKTIDLI